jgi:hypothetical protein
MLCLKIIGVNKLYPVVKVGWAMSAFSHRFIFFIMRCFMRSVVFSKGEIVKQICDKLESIDSDILCTIYQIISDNEVCYIGDGLYEFIDYRDEEEDSSYDYRCNEDVDEILETINF